MCIKFHRQPKPRHITSNCDISYVFYEAQDSALRLTVWNPAVIASVAVPNVYLARREAFTGTARYSASNGLQHNRYLILFGV